MRENMELVGKTISGVVSSPAPTNGPRRIWMLQFTDGTHVEFVSPNARRGLQKMTGMKKRAVKNAVPDPQLALNVA